MFENPRRGRQARNFTTNVSNTLHLKLLPNRYFPKIYVGFPRTSDESFLSNCVNNKMLESDWSFLE